MDLSGIPGGQVRKEIRETIENQLQSQNYRVTVTAASKEGENNFVGVVYRVSFNAVDESENNTKSSMIVKVAPQNETRRTQFHLRERFLQEIFMYNEVLSYFRQFELSKGVINKENGFTEYPICYRTLDEDPSECLLLEDLNIRGFSIIDRFTEEVTADHVRLFMKALGKLHALSFALNDQQPEKFQALASNLKECIRTDNSVFRDYFRKQTEHVLDILRHEEDTDLLSRMKDLFKTDAIDIAANCLNPKSAENGSVISYGDAWQNNSMYRYDDQGKPIEISFLDWQISRHSTPIIDIAYFIFSCTTKELRDAHYDEFLNIYHDNLSAHIHWVLTRTNYFLMT
ncbi:uncharacterized protein LOC129565999 isoform X2 [Sitodiplosis mosellana]|uniref:uncharacterized protein LOC129565999 isoform X2 n=1 Tax=Sitodiplosis mosellana TaxID=263140 RepID=UPI0024449B50|nr:uncharacterized protein LOC129565999 isoform X2 [Sitodiplosis mosellana]